MTKILGNIFRKNYVHAPILTGTEKTREAFFGEKTTPKQSHPFSRRGQYNQGNSPICTVASRNEIIENKVFWETGEWYTITEDETFKTWDKMKEMGIAGESWGAYINSPLIAGQEERITMIQQSSGKTLQVSIKDWFTISKNDDDFIDQVKSEICYGGGVLTGINNRMSKLDYQYADKAPYIVTRRSNPHPIAHAINLAEFDDTGERTYIPKGTIASSGTWGDSFGDNGVVYIKEEDISALFAPIGFTLNYY